MEDVAYIESQFIMCAVFGTAEDFEVIAKNFVIGDLWVFTCEIWEVRGNRLLFQSRSNIEYSPSFLY